MQEVTHVQIPVKLVNATLEYLVHRPFDEVFDLIVNLKQEAELSFAAQNDSGDKG